MIRHRVLAVFLVLPALLPAQSTGGISGKLTDDSGAAAANATVSATLQGTASHGTFSPTLSVKTGSDGKFSLTGLAAGAYRLCAQNASGGLLDPCLWTANPTMVTVATGENAGGVSLVAMRGVKINVQVNDAQGLLSGSGAVDDILIGIKGASAGSPFLAASLVSKSNGGKTVSLVVPPGKAVNVFTYSKLYQLADSLGKKFSTPSVVTSVVAPNLASSPAGVTGTTGTTAAAGSQAAPVLELNVMGPAPKTP